MSKFDSFFESPSDKNLNDKVLKNAKIELENNRVRGQRKKLFWLVPLTTAFAGLVLFKFNTANRNNRIEPVADNEDQLDMTAQLMEDDEMLDLLVSMDMLEDLEFLESDENMEEG